MSIVRGPHRSSRTRPSPRSTAWQRKSNACGVSVVRTRAQAFTKAGWSVLPHAGVR